MLDKTLNTHIVLRNDTSENWKTSNPILLKGEAGYETDTRKLKFGDGITAYNDLPYTIDADSGGGGSGGVLTPEQEETLKGIRTINIKNDGQEIVQAFFIELNALGEKSDIVFTHLTQGYGANFSMSATMPPENKSLYDLSDEEMSSMIMTPDRTIIKGGEYWDNLNIGGGTYGVYAGGNPDDYTTGIQTLGRNIGIHVINQDATKAELVSNCTIGSLNDKITWNETDVELKGNTRIHNALITESGSTLDLTSNITTITNETLTIEDNQTGIMPIEIEGTSFIVVSIEDMTGVNNGLFANVGGGKNIHILNKTGSTVTGVKVSLLRIG